MKLRWHLVVVVFGVALLHLFMWIATVYRPNEINVFSAVGFFPLLAGMQVAHWLGQGGHPAVNVPASIIAWIFQCLVCGLLLDAAVVFVMRRFRRRN